MEPARLDAALWAQIGRVLDLLYLFAALSIAGATAFLLGRAIVPSLEMSGDAAGPLLVLRRAFYPLLGAALLLALLALARALLLAVALLRQLYPRFAI
jgi:hypothetical protein